MPPRSRSSKSSRSERRLVPAEQKKSAIFSFQPSYPEPNVNYAAQGRKIYARMRSEIYGPLGPRSRRTIIEFLKDVVRHR